MNLNLTSQNIYSALMCRLPIFAGPFIYYLPCKVKSVTVALFYINVQHEYELSSSTSFRQFQKFGKIWVGAMSSAATPKEAIYARGLSSCYTECVNALLKQNLRSNWKGSIFDIEISKKCILLYYIFYYISLYILYIILY